MNMYQVYILGTVMWCVAHVVYITSTINFYDAKGYHYFTMIMSAFGLMVGVALLLNSGFSNCFGG